MKKCKKCGKVCKNKQGLSKHVNKCVPTVRTVIVDGEVYVHLDEYTARINKIMF